MVKIIKAIAVLLVFALAGIEVNAQTDTKVVVITMPGDEKPAGKPVGPFVAAGDNSDIVFIAVNLADGTFTARVGTSPTASESLSFRTRASSSFAYATFNGFWDSVSNTGDLISMSSSLGYAFQSTLAQGGYEYVLYAQVRESNSAEITVDNLIVIKK